MGSSSSQTPVTQQTTQNRDPWSAAQPGLIEAMENARGYFQSDVGYQPFTGNTTAPLGADWTAAATAGRNLIAGENYGSGNLANARGFTNDLVQNQGLNSNLRDMASTLAGQQNPYLQGVIDQQMNKANSAMSGGGRYGSGAHSAAIAQAIAPTLAQDYMQRQGMAADIYSQGLQRAGQAAQLTPTLDDARFGNLDRLMGIGAQQRSYDQALLDQQLKLWNAQQARPWEQLSRMNAIQGQAGGLGGTQVTSSPGATQPSTMQKILGGGLAGAGIGSSFGGPAGAGIGALGGGLLGLM